MRLVRSGLFLVLLCGVTETRAGGIPPTKPPLIDQALINQAVAYTPKVRHLVWRLHLGSFSATFEETRLDDIRQRIGTGHADRAGDASESIRWYCYSLPGQLVWLVSGEMGGGERLTSVAAQSIEPSDPRRPSCPTIPESLRPVTLEFGWLGTSRGLLEEALGKPSLVRGDWLAFHYVEKVRRPYKSPPDAQAREVDFDVASSIYVRIEEGIVAELHANHVTSY